MEFRISVKSLDDISEDGQMCPGPYSPFSAEAELGSFSKSGAPKSFIGKLNNVPLEKILEFKFTPGVAVSFRGFPYTFEELEKDGAFKLRRGVGEAMQ